MEGTHTAAKNQVISDDVVELNIDGIEGYDDDSLIIMRKESIKRYPQLLNGDNPPLIEIPDQASALKNRVLCAKICNVSGIPDGMYILYRLNEKSSNITSSDIGGTSVSRIESTLAQNENILSNASGNLESTTAQISGLNYQNFLHLLESFNNPQHFSFDEVKSYLHGNGFTVNSKQLTYFIFRAVNRKILEIIGKKMYRVRVDQSD